MFWFYVCTFRANVLFVLLFTCITPACGCIAGIFYELANGHSERAHNCQLVSHSPLSSFHNPANTTRPPVPSSSAPAASAGTSSPA